MNESKDDGTERLDEQSGSTPDEPETDAAFEGIDGDDDSNELPEELRDVADEILKDDDEPITEPPPRRIAFGEVVSKRHPILIALVMIFALFLAVAPLLFRYERNALHEAVSVYTEICEARASGRITDDWLKGKVGPRLGSMDSTDRAAFIQNMECLNPSEYSFELRAVEGRALGKNRAYVLSVFKGPDVKKAEKAGAHVSNHYFPMIENRLVLDVMPTVR